MYKQTNSYFFSSNSVFLALWNPRAQQDMQLALSEYVQAVQTRSPGAQVVFVSTHADTRVEPTGVDAALQQLKLQDAKHFHVSCKDGTGIQDLIKHLRRVVMRLPHVQQEVPRSYLDLERVLKKSIIAHHVPYEVVPLRRVIISCHLDPVPVQMDEDQVPSTV